MTRFHEQLKQPATLAHDRACAEIMKLPKSSVLSTFFPTWSRASLECVSLEWCPEEPVREPHRGNLVGFIDLAALVQWVGADKEDRQRYLGIEVKTSAESIGNAVRQAKTYRGGLVRCSHVPMTYGQVDLNRTYAYRLADVALALPRDEITEEVRLLTTGVPLIAWPLPDTFGLDD
jgi:hypothetical protein